MEFKTKEHRKHMAYLYFCSQKKGTDKSRKSETGNTPEQSKGLDEMELIKV